MDERVRPTISILAVLFCLRALDFIIAVVVVAVFDFFYPVRPWEPFSVAASIHGAFFAAFVFFVATLYPLISISVVFPAVKLMQRRGISPKLSIPIASAAFLVVYAGLWYFLKAPQWQIEIVGAILLSGALVLLTARLFVMRLEIK